MDIGDKVKEYLPYVAGGVLGIAGEVSVAKFSSLLQRAGIDVSDPKMHKLVTGIGMALLDEFVVKNSSPNFSPYMKVGSAYEVTSAVRDFIREYLKLSREAPMELAVTDETYPEEEEEDYEML